MMRTIAVRKFRVAALFAALFAAVVAAAAFKPTAFAQALAYVQTVNPTDAIQIAPNGVPGANRWLTLQQLRGFFLGAGATCSGPPSKDFTVTDGLVTRC